MIFGLNKTDHLPISDNTSVFRGYQNRRTCSRPNPKKFGIDGSYSRRFAFSPIERNLFTGAQQGIVLSGSIRRVIRICSTCYRIHSDVLSDSIHRPASLDS